MLDDLQSLKIIFFVQIHKKVKKAIKREIFEQRFCINFALKKLSKRIPLGCKVPWVVVNFFFCEKSSFFVLLKKTKFCIQLYDFVFYRDINQDKILKTGKPRLMTYGWLTDFWNRKLSFFGLFQWNFDG
jgi:hypothetical protein